MPRLLVSLLVLSVTTSAIGRASAQAAAEAARVRVDGVVAVVGGSAPGPNVGVVLRSDVDLAARLALAARAPETAARVALTRELQRASLDTLVGEHLIAREAERVRISAPSSAEVARERLRIEDAVGGAGRLEALLTAVGATSVEIDVIAERRAVVAAFLRANLEGTGVITDAELEVAYTGGDHPFVGRPLEEVRDPLRAFLARRAIDRSVARWVSLLRGRTTLRIVERFEPPPTGAPDRRDR